MDKFSRNDVIDWLAGNLDDPGKVQSIEDDLQRGPESEARAIVDGLRQKVQRLRETERSGEKARLLAERLRREGGELDPRPNRSR